MLKDIWQNYGWIFFLVFLIILNIVCLKLTRKRISGSHRGVHYSRKETWGDIFQGIAFLGFLGYIIYLIFFSLFSFGK